MMAAAAQGRPLLLIDIAVPRDIDPALRRAGGRQLYDIDDLQAVVARNLDTRASEVPRAEEIVEEEIQPLRGLARPARRAADGERAA